MTQKSNLGRKGEEFAVTYLKKNGYWMVDRNVKIYHDELDIIAEAPNKTLVFVEVKTVTDPGDFGARAEEHMTKEKRERFERAASLYAGSHPKEISNKRGWRLDVIALTAYDNSFTSKHYENI